MTDEELRNYLGVLSFLLAALSFLANERREAVAALHKRSDVSKFEKALAVISVLFVMLVAGGLVASAWPAVDATGLDLGDLVRLDTAVRQAFVLGWVLLIAMTLAAAALFARAVRISTKT